MRSAVKDLIPYNPGPSVKELEQQIKRPIIRISANESLWGPSPKVKEIILASLGDLGFYPDGGAALLKKELSRFINRPVSSFCLGNGADDLIFLISAVFLDPNDEVLIPVPTFGEYEIAVRAAGGECRLVSQPGLQFDLKSLGAQINSRTKMIFICNPNNPTGGYVTHRELKEFLTEVPRDILIVLDEAYGDYADKPDFPASRSLLAEHPNLIVLRTFSKLYSLASLRIGYATASEKLIREMEKIRQPFNVNSFAQKAAVAALQDQAYYNKVREETIAARTWITDALEALSIQVLPSQANFILFKAPEAALLADKLLQKGFLVRQTDSFGLPDHIRITVGPLSVMKDFASALKSVLTP